MTERHTLEAGGPEKSGPLCLCGCGQSLRNRNRQAKFWSDQCRTRYHKARTKLYRPFVALDGEGENRPDGSHIYTLLAVGKLVGGKDIRSKQGLDTETCLDFLLNLPKQSVHGVKPIYIWFAMDYDVNMILGDLELKGETDDDIRSLREKGTVIWRGYRITYIPRKIFRVSRGNRRHTSYDIWGFFQSSFERACAEWGIELPSIIAEGKRSRSGFSRWSLARIADYNRAELDALEALAEKLREAAIPLALPAHGWHGPAALAGAWLRKNNVKRYLKKVPDFEDVFERAYFGGRIDVTGYGIVNPVYHYDIVSAYPSAIRNLPDLSKLEWSQRREPDSGRLYAARVSWEIPPAYWAPFPWRAKDGSIRYPLRGEGWYWKPELEAAQQKYGERHFRIQEVIQAEGELEYPFRDLIEGTFTYRAKLKASGNPSHVPVKLILNSLYGKFAQSVGKPAFRSLIWAGLVTAYTRAQLLEALSEDVVCVMTDSLWSRKPLDIPLGDRLGDWERQEEAELVLAEAGLYQATTPSGDLFIWQRGFDKRNPVDVRGIVSHWLGDDPTYTAIYKVSRFIGMGLASITSYPWRHWLELERRVAPVPLVGTSKRLPVYPLENGVGLRGGENFVNLELRPCDEKVVSYSYRKATLDPELIAERLQDECSDE